MSLQSVLAGVAGGFLTGGPGGAVMGGVAGLLGSGGAGAASAPGTAIIRSTPSLPGLPQFGSRPGTITRSGPGTVLGVPIMAPGYGFGGKLRGRVAPSGGGVSTRVAPEQASSRGWNRRAQYLRA